MKIKAYSFLQEGQTPRAGHKQDTPPATRRSLPLLPKKDGNGENTGLSEGLRTRMRACLAQVHSAQAEITSVREAEDQLAEAEKLYRETGRLVSPGEERAKNMELLYHSLGKIRNMMDRLVPGFAGETWPAQAVGGNRSPEKNNTQTLSTAQNSAGSALESLSVSLEIARQKLAARKNELIGVIAHNLVAVENIAASHSAIRDFAYAQRVVAEVNNTLAIEGHHPVFFQANRENIAALLR